MHTFLKEWSEQTLCTLGMPFAPVWGGLKALPPDAAPEENIAEHVKPRPKPSNEAKLTITPRMATFTFADVLRSQGLYEQAYEVLEMMRDKSSNIERIEREQEKLKDLMHSSDDS
jgi:hypothetical protein